jgi:hypothetical protein
MKIVPMVEEENSLNNKFTPSYDKASSFVLTSKNIGGLLAMKTTNRIGKHEVTTQVLESTTRASMNADYLTLLKIDK